MGGTGLRRARVQTTATAMAGIVLVLVIAGLGLVQAFERGQTRQVDEQLESTVDFFDRARAGDFAGLGDQAGPDDLIQVVDDDGEVFYASDLLADAPPLLEVDELDDGGALRTTRVEGVGRLRVTTADLDETRVIIFGVSLEAVDDAVSTLTRSLLIGFPFVVLALGAVVWLIVGRILRPVEDAMHRERRLVADASHDLRSPLAGVRALLETESADPADVEQNRIDALATLARLETIAEDLLTLARSDRRGEEDPPRRLVDLDEVVLRQVHAHRSLGPAIDTTELSGGQVVGVESDLERMVENLLSNATRHARSQVWVALDEDRGEVELTIGDDGAGIPELDRERVFERFTRLDESRTNSSGGAGLGLAIVRAVATDHGGAVAVRTSKAGGAELRVVLPASLAAD